LSNPCASYPSISLLVALEKAKLLCGTSRQDRLDDDGLEEYLVSDPRFNREVAVKYLNGDSINNNLACEHSMGNCEIDIDCGKTDPEIDFETIDLLLEPMSEHRSNNRFEEDESKYEIETIDLSLNLSSADHVSGYSVHDSKHKIVDSSLDPALRSRAHRCKEDETDLEFAATNQALEFKALDSKRNLYEDDTELDYQGIE
jgi:hypothetical protein